MLQCGPLQKKSRTLAGLGVTAANCVHAPYTMMMTMMLMTTMRGGNG